MHTLENASFEKTETNKQVSKNMSQLASHKEIEKAII